MIASTRGAGSCIRFCRGNILDRQRLSIRPPTGALPKLHPDLHSVLNSLLRTSSTRRYQDYCIIGPLGANQLVVLNSALQLAVATLLAVSNTGNKGGEICDKALRSGADLNLFLFAKSARPASS